LEPKDVEDFCEDFGIELYRLSGDEKLKLAKVYVEYLKTLKELSNGIID